MGVNPNPSELRRRQSVVNTLVKKLRDRGIIEGDGDARALLLNELHVGNQQ